MRRAAKTDDNHSEIIGVFRKAGCGVLDLSRVGKGCPDLLVHLPQYPWDNFLVEIKDGRKPPSARRLTEDQEKFHGRWRGPIYVVESVEQALNLLR